MKSASHKVAGMADYIIDLVGEKLVCGANAPAALCESLGSGIPIFVTAHVAGRMLYPGIHLSSPENLDFG